MTCPKEDGPNETLKDIVDDTIIWFAETMVGHRDIKWVCLVSGDGDYVPMLKRIKAEGIKIALVVPTVAAYSRLDNMAQLVDFHPKTGKKMSLSLDKVFEGV